MPYEFLFFKNTRRHTFQGSSCNTLSFLFCSFKLPKHSWVGKRSKDNMIVLPSRQEAVVDLASRGGWAHPPSNQLWVLLLCALLLCCLCEKPYTEGSGISTHRSTFVLTTADIWIPQLLTIQLLTARRQLLLYKDSSMVFSGNKGLQREGV